MRLVPVDSVGACIGNKYVREEYPDYRKVTIEPNGSLTGEIDLRREIPELDEALKKSEVHLFWFYRPPETTRGVAHWAVCRRLGTDSAQKMI